MLNPSIFFRPLCSRSAQNIGVTSIQYSHGGAPIKLSTGGAQLNLYILVSVLTLQSPVEASSQGDRLEVCLRCFPRNGEHLSRSYNQQRPNKKCTRNILLTALSSIQARFFEEVEYCRQ